MVLAAGLGKRMRPITDSLPKPLVPVLGTPMLETIISRLKAAQITSLVVNAFYLKEQIRDFITAKNDPSLTVSEEDVLLETGGGVALALPKLGQEPFIVVNGDVCWLEGAEPAFERLMAAWDPEVMDALLLLHPTCRAVGYEGNGDFSMEPSGRLIRRQEQQQAPFVFAGIQILHPKLFEKVPAGAFSLNLIYNKALESERLYGLRHEGEWFHVGTPEGLAEVEERLKDRSNPSDFF